jgi:hypothetical protein
MSINNNSLKKIQCKCGRSVVRKKLQRHLRTKIHLKGLVGYVVPVKVKEEKIECNCGGRYTKPNKNRHLGTKKHQAYNKKNNKELNLLESKLNELKELQFSPCDKDFQVEIIKLLKSTIEEYKNKNGFSQTFNWVKKMCEELKEFAK